MGAVYFYHLTERPLEATLPILLEKSVAAGWRVELRGVTPERADWLDAQLWQGGARESFLPHGRAGGTHDADQPILLTHAGQGAPGASCLVAYDGAELSPEEVAGAARAMILFDGRNEAAVQVARGQWKTLTDAGCAAQYWAYEGGWIKKAEAGGSEGGSGG